MEGIMKDKILEKDEKVIYECRPNIKEASVPERGNLIMAIVLFIMFILSVIFLIVPGMILLGLMTGAIFYVVIHDSLKNKEIALNEEYIITDKRIIIYNKKDDNYVYGYHEILKDFYKGYGHGKSTDLYLINKKIHNNYNKKVEEVKENNPQNMTFLRLTCLDNVDEVIMTLKEVNPKLQFISKEDNDEQ